MRDAHLGDAPPTLAQLDQQFARQEPALRFEPDPLERFAPEQLARAVRILDLETEPPAQRKPVEASVSEPDEGVRALESVAHHNVGLVWLLNARQQAAHIGDLELAITVGEGDERAT